MNVIPHTIVLSDTTQMVRMSSSESWQLRSVGSLSEIELAALESLAFEYGQSPDSYLVIEPYRQCFLMADHTAAVSVLGSRRYLHISGGILAPVALRPCIINQLSQYATSTNCIISCYAVSEFDRSMFETAGWEVTKFGETTSISLLNHTWSGKPYEWVRRQYNYCQRMGLKCREMTQHSMTIEAWKLLTEELFEIQRDDLQHRIYAVEINLLAGKLLPDLLGRRRLFIAEDSSSCIQGFVIANPMRGGSGWGLEMYRKRCAAPRGTVPFLIKWIIDEMKKEGIEEVSVCMLLWKGSSTFVGTRTSWIVRWGLVLAYELGNLIYNTKGMTHFKTRFRPELSNCYVCVTPKATVLSCISFFRTVGAFRFSLQNIARNCWNGLFRRSLGRHSAGEARCVIEDSNLQSQEGC